MRPFEVIPPAEYKLFLQALREDRCIEYPIVGWQAVGEWLYKMQFTTRIFKPSTLLNWRARFGLPVLTTARDIHRSNRSKPWCTNLMLHAWLATQGRALTLPRWHPFRQKVEKPRKPYDQCSRRTKCRRRAEARGRTPAAILAARWRVQRANAPTDAPPDIDRYPPGAVPTSIAPS